MIIVVMGVTGAGKTTIGRALAGRLGWAFEDADDLHSPGNRAKMAAGHPLSDADRGPWLAALAVWVRGHDRAVLACSLLKRAYRAEVLGGSARIALVWLHAAPEMLRARLAARRGHFMPASLLDSQLATLEAPGVEEHAICVDVGGTVEETVERVVGAVGMGR